MKCEATLSEVFPYCVVSYTPIRANSHAIVDSIIIDLKYRMQPFPTDAAVENVLCASSVGQ